MAVATIFTWCLTLSVISAEDIIRIPLKKERSSTLRSGLKVGTESYSGTGTAELSLMNRLNAQYAGKAQENPITFVTCAMVDGLKNSTC
eukprot:symbB.v1.2.002329.t1/scaffold123.1/size315817/14